MWVCPQFLHDYFPLIFLSYLRNSRFINRLEIWIINWRPPFLYIKRLHRVNSLVILSIRTCDPLELLNLNDLIQSFLDKLVYTHVVSWMIWSANYFSIQNLVLFLIQMKVYCGTNPVQSLSLLQWFLCQFKKRVDRLIIFTYILYKSTVVSELWLQLLLVMFGFRYLLLSF